MQIMPVSKAERTERVLDALVAIWEASVRPTHLFLSEDDIVELRPRVRQGLIGIATLVVASDEEGNPVGFLGVEDGKVEMLFIAPEVFGMGVGGRLLDYATQVLGACKLDVNEGNPGARGFYEHKGFAVVGRSDLDGEGRPFPILHMELHE